MSQEFGYGGFRWGELRARSNVIRQTEKFFVYQIGSQYAFQSLLPPNSTCCYVSAEIGDGGGYYGMLRARSYSVGSWELFSLFDLGGFGGGFSPMRSASTQTGVAGGAPLIYAKSVECPASLRATLKEPCKKLIPRP